MAASAPAPNEQTSDSAAVNDAANLTGLSELDQDSIELRKIKKFKASFAVGSAEDVGSRSSKSTSSRRMLRV